MCIRDRVTKVQHGIDVPGTTIHVFYATKMGKDVYKRQVQKLLGHSQIDTTMQYAIVNQTNVKTSHQKFIA